MTTATADVLALLRAGCEWAGQAQGKAGARWTIYLFPAGALNPSADDADILSEPYASNLLGALLARLRRDGWAWSVESDYDGGALASRVLRNPSGRLHGIGLPATHPDSPLLALLYAMRDAGIIRAETRAAP